MDTYDYILIGSSISNLLTATTLKQKYNILVLEKDNFIGGAWRNSNEIFKNIDIVGHLIVPENDTYGDEIINYFKNNIGIQLCHIDKDDFYYETDNWRSCGKQGTPIICSTGWADYTNKILDYIKSFKNITIKKNCLVKSIKGDNNLIKIHTNDNIYISKNVVIPTYCNLNNIIHCSNKINIPYKTIINKHLLIEVEFDNCNVSRNFQGFYDKEPIGIFDRITLSILKKEYTIISCRISKHFKQISINDNYGKIVEFIKNTNIFNDFKILKIHIYNYNCSYRDIPNRQLFFNNLLPLKNVYPINTIYKGHFLKQFVDKTIINYSLSS